MSTHRALPGLEILGLNYDVTGYYADARSIEPLTPLFNLGLGKFNPDSAADVGTMTVGGTPYSYPTVLTVVPINSSQVVEQTTKSVTDFQLHLNVSAQAGAWYEGFSGSVEASFDSNYRTSTSFYSLTEVGLVQSYSITLPGLSSLRNQYLTPEASQDINGSMPPTELVNKYGAFFLSSGIFGGALNYSQSISVYSVETQQAAAAKVSANYMGFVSGSISSSVQVDQVATTEQSNGHFEAKGGSPDQLKQGYQAWAAALVKGGDFALVNFNKYSLTPLWMLAESTSRQNAIEAAVSSMLSSTPPMLNALAWDQSNNKTFYAAGSNKDNIEKMITLRFGAQVIVGVACSVHSDNVSRLAVRVLDLRNNSISWLTDDGSVYNQSNYQRVADIPAATTQRGVAVTGMGFTCTSDAVSGIWLHYQMLNPADSNAAPTFLGSVVNTLYAGDAAHQKKSPEVDFTPDAGAGKPITAVGLRVHKDSFVTMVLSQAPLITHQVSVAAVESDVQRSGEPLPVNV